MNRTKTIEKEIVGVQRLDTKSNEKRKKNKIDFFIYF